MNYGTVFQEKRQADENLQMCMKQYEERFKRLSDHMETGNQTYQKAQDELKRLKLNQESTQQARDQFLNHLLERSNALKAKVIKLASDKGK